MEAEVDWGSVRGEFRVLRDRTYLMTAAVGAVHRRVRDATAHWVDFTFEKAASEDGKYFELLSRARGEVARFLGVEIEDAAFGPNTSFLMNILALMLKNGPRRRVVLPADEFPASVLAWFHHGFDVKLVPSRDGRIDVSELLDKAGGDAAAVVVSGVQFLHGFRIDLVSLGRELRSRGIPLIVNGTQMMGAFRVPLKECGASAFAASCHKWFGSGIGQAVFYASPEFRERFPWPVAGWAGVEDPMAMRNEPPLLKKDAGAIQVGSLPFANLAAIMESCRVVTDIGLERISERILELSDYLEEGLRSLPVRINTCRTPPDCRSGIINFSPKDPSILDKVLTGLRDKKVFVNSRRGSIRASVHYYNSRGDIDALIERLTPLL